MTVESPAPSVRSYFESLQVLRAVAAIMVVIAHVLHEVGVTAVKMGDVFPQWAHETYPYGAGVHIFFVLSGFLMVYTAQKLFGEKGAWAIFLKKRIIRIVPLYWFYTSVMVIVMLVLPSAFDTARLDLSHVVQSYLFIPHERPSVGIRPLLSLGWTLNLEMFFYVVFALFLFLSRKSLIILMAVLFTGLVVANVTSFIPREMKILIFWSNPIILEFVAGMIFAHLYIKGFRFPFIVMPLGLLACALIFFFLPTIPAPSGFSDSFIPKFLIGVIAVGVVVLSDKAAEMRMPWVLKEMGNSSYTLYLAHPFFIGAVALIAMKLNLSLWMHVCLSICTCVIGSYVAYRLIEKPMLNFLQRKKI